MNVSLANILKNPLFENAALLAGADGRFRTVARVSVFDSPFGMDVVEKGIVMPGDFFVTGLLRFDESPEQVLAVFEVLIAGQCSGVCLIREQCDSLISDAVLALCDKHHFPLVYLAEDIAYAQIMDTVNRFISLENLNLINQLRLDKICNEQTTMSERLHLLESMNQQVGELVQTVYFQGELLSKLTEYEWNTRYLSQKQDIFIDENSVKLIILSAEDEKTLRAHLDVTKNTIAQYFAAPVLGISRPYPRHWIARSVQEARTALDMALASGRQEQTYDPLSITQLLLPLRCSREAQDFYAAFISALRSGASADGSHDLWRTVQVFVRCAGDYRKAAQTLNQHENTIRYRINRVKSLLDMEHDPVIFYETISVAVHIQGILGKNEDFENIIK